MRRVLVLVILSLLIGASMTVVPAVIEPGRAAIGAADEATLRQAIELLNHKQPATALTKLMPLRPTLAGQVDFDLVYGIALLESGKPRQAETSFRRVLTVQPENLLARAHLARALAANGELDDARREIMVLRDRADLPPDIRSVMENNLARIDEARKQRAEAKARAVAQAQTQAASQTAGKQLSEQDVAKVRAAAELVRDEKSAAAFAQLAPMEACCAGNPDFDYVYGIAALDSGHPAQAVVALRRGLGVRPDFYIARAELGRALAAMGDLAGAKREFEQVQNVPDLPPVARDALGRQVAAIDQAVAKGAKHYSGYLESSFGYDTNVNAGPSGQTLLIPALAFLGPATISSQAMPKKSAFYELAGGFSGTLPIDNETALFTNLAGNIHPLFSDNSQFGSALAGGEAGVARQVQDLGILSVAGVAQTFVLGGKVFRNIFGAAGQWRQQFDNVWDTSIALSWLRLNYPNVDCTPAPAGCQDTNRYTLTGTLGGRFDAALKPGIYLALSGGEQLAIASAFDYFSFTFIGARAGVEVSPLAWLTFFAQAAYEDDLYDADYPLFFYKRHDQLFDVLGGVQFKFTDAWSLRTSLDWSETQSNISIFTYQRWIAQAALRWAF
jgi:outer membrane protein